MSNTSVAAMSSRAQYSALDHGGLEIAPQLNADGPEVVPGSNAPLERSSSLNRPEPVIPAEYGPDKHDRNQAHASYYGASEGEAAAPAYTDNGRPGYMNPHGKEGAGMAHQPYPGKPEGRRYCGMRRPIFIAVIVAAVVIVLAAVLGGVLGTVLNKHSSSSNSSGSGSGSGSTSPDAIGLNSSSVGNEPLQALSLTGLTSTVAAEDGNKLLMYYQDGSDRIIENAYLAGAWTLNNMSLIDDSVVTTQATAGSPLAAISYGRDGTNTRQVFFFDGQGLLRETNSTTTTVDGIASAWSAPQVIATDASSPGTPALSACWDTQSFEGIRVYYGSILGGIQEVGWDFNGTAWTELNFFGGSDPNSGVACVTYDHVNSPNSTSHLLNVYLRDVASGTIEQNWLDFTVNGTWNSNGPSTSSTDPVTNGTDIAVCSDGGQDEYVFYQSTGGIVVRGLVGPDAANFTSFEPLQSASTGAKLAAAYFGGGATLLFQNASSASTMWLADVSRSNVTLSNIDIT